MPRDRSEWIAVKVPAIITESEYDEVQARLAMHHPHVTAPRTVSSPTLLASVGVCGECSAGLVLQTGKGGRYHYYICQRKRTESVAACVSKPRPMAEVDAIVIAALEHDVLAPDRIEALLIGLLDRSSQASADRARDIARIRAERTLGEAALRSVWTMIESGHAAAADADVAERMALHRSRITRIGSEIRVLEDQQAARARRITLDIVQRFAASVPEALRGDDPNMRRNYLRLLVDRVERRSDGLLSSGAKKALELAVAAEKHGGKSSRFCPGLVRPERFERPTLRFVV